MTPKPFHLESWNFERMLTPHHVPQVMHHMSCVTCHVSCVTCHVLCVTCHMPCVTYHIIKDYYNCCFSFVFVFFVEKNIKLIYIKKKNWNNNNKKNWENCGAIYLKVCYQQGLSCLVLDISVILYRYICPKYNCILP